VIDPRCARCRLRGLADHAATTAHRGLGKSRWELGRADHRRPTRAPNRCPSCSALPRWLRRQRVRRNPLVVWDAIRRIASETAGAWIRSGPGGEAFVGSGGLL